MLALVDCNNFYASCERVFRPDLRTKPVVVLSNNDGCVIARCVQSKTLGIEMGAPYFQIRDKLAQAGVTVFSSNYALYGDFSARVMKILQTKAPAVEVYSIDEAFLDLSGFRNRDQYCRNLKADVEQSTGIPVSVGVAPTKTLAKIANRIAKMDPASGGVFILPNDPTSALAQIDVQDVWGVGRRLGRRLNEMGIKDARSLQKQDPRFIRQHFSVVLEKTVRELQGVPCFAFNEAPPHPQHIMVSRGFKGRVHTLKDLQEAVALYASRAAEKARQKKVFAHRLSVFVNPPLKEAHRQPGSSATMIFPQATNNTPTLIKAALEGLRKILVEGSAYQKAGITLSELVYAHESQPSLFTSGSDEGSSANLMKTLDRINQRFGRETVRIASSGFTRNWWMAREHLSPCYTSNWKDLQKVSSD